MQDEHALFLLDVLDGLAAGYKDLAERVYSAEQALLTERENLLPLKLYAHYVQTRNRVQAREPGTGLETEKWNVLAERIQQGLSELRQQFPPRSAKG